MTIEELNKIERYLDTLPEEVSVIHAAAFCIKYKEIGKKLCKELRENMKVKPIDPSWILAKNTGAVFSFEVKGAVFALTLEETQHLREQIEKAMYNYFEMKGEKENGREQG